MTSSVYIRAILSCVLHIAEVADKIDELIYDMALNTGKSPSLSTYTQAEKIILLMNKKNNLINLKLILDTGLSKIDLKNRQLLSLRYFENRGSDEIINVLNISRRTYFRAIDRALNALTSYFFSQGFDEKWFAENYFDQNWIRNIYNELKTREKTAKLLNNKLV